MKREDLVEYFRTYYAPGNCILVLTGDFDSKDALARITKSFGTIPKQPPPAEPPDSEPEQRGERRVQVHYPAENVTFLAGYKAPAVKSPDIYPIDVMLNVLSAGESSRLHQALVYEKQIALAAQAFFQTSLNPSLITAYVSMKPGKTAAEGIAAMDEVIDRLVREGPTARELQKAKNQLEASFVESLKTNNGVGRSLGFYEHVFGDYRNMFRVTDRYRAVTVADVKRVAKTYFDRKHRTISELVPENTQATAAK
jgi:zinc protease